MTSIYQITEKGLEEIRKESRSRDWFEEIEKIQGQFKSYTITRFATVQGEAGFIELLASSKLNSDGRRK